MIPPITLAFSAELIRDGGSLAATFQATNGSEYWLFFKVRSALSGQREPLFYESPQLLERMTGESIEVSWQHALVLLSTLRPLLSEESHLSYLEVMFEVARNKGAVPLSISQRFRKPQRATAP